MSSQAYKLVASPVFKITLERLCSFLSRKYSSELAIKTKRSIQSAISKNLAGNPHIGPICDRLLGIGVAGYRQLLVDEHNIVIYRVNEEENEILLLLVFDTRQSLEKLLSEVNLLV